MTRCNAVGRRSRLRLRAETAVAYRAFFTRIAAAVLRGKIKDGVSLTQSKLLAFHRLMRTDKPIMRCGCSGREGRALGAAGGDTGMPSAVDFGGFVAGVG